MCSLEISWPAVEAVGVWCNALLVVASLWFIYGQVRTAAQTFELGTIERLQNLVDSFADDRRRMFDACSLALAASSEQFSRTPPGRHRAPPPSISEIERPWFTDEQKRLIQEMDDVVRDSARRIIGKLNDIGQLIEDGYLSRRVVLGKYHALFIQCCHMVEAVRREEERRRGGNYGQRLLRMRLWATRYNDMHPKHRQKPIRIWNQHEYRQVYASPVPTFLNRCEWALRRFFSRY